MGAEGRGATAGRGPWHSSVGLAALALAASGCLERSFTQVTTCARSSYQELIRVPVADDAVDLLFMIDDSSSMSEEQASIVSEIPRIVRILLSGDRNEDGVRDFAPIRSLHLGVVSSDMGTGSVSGIESCSAGFGDDGIILNRGGVDCAVTCGAPIFEFRARSVAAPFACGVTLGTSGCGLEQQLEASLKAVSLAPGDGGGSPVGWTRRGYRPPIFRDGTLGHGGADGCNDGFLRPASSLVIVLVTDEDDCSLVDPSIFDPDDPRFAGVDLNLRCHTFADALQPIDRYVEGFVGLRAAPSFLTFAAITGVPLDAADSGLSYQAILDLPEMTESIDPALGNRLLPACTAPGGRGVAYPARRIVEVAQGLERLGAGTSVQSICNATFASAVDTIITRLADAASSVCLPRELNTDAAGRVECEVLELLPAIGGEAEHQHCAELPNADAFELVDVEVTSVAGAETRRELCRVRRLGRTEAGAMPGWFYDDGDPRLGAWSARPHDCHRRIAFSVTSPVPGAEIRVSCAESILPGSAAAAQLGSFCDPGTGEVSRSPGVRCDDGIATPGFLMSRLACDPFERTCQVACGSDADCAAAGLRGYRCDDRSAAEVFGASRPVELPADQIHDFCVSSLCEDP